MIKLRNILNEVNKKQELLDTIKSALENMRMDGSRPDDDVDMFSNGVGVSFRDLGRWEDDEEMSSDYEDPDSDDYDPSWREDNDQQVWAHGEYKRYMQKFTDWAKFYSWYKYVKLSIETSEKNWCEFRIELK
jgi:hypothetical protein